MSRLTHKLSAALFRVEQAETFAIGGSVSTMRPESRKLIAILTDRRS